MGEKRERRCETCLAWERADNIDWNGLCHADTRPRLCMRDHWCLNDYVPMDLECGLPDARELLERIQSNMDLLDRQWKKIGELEDRLNSFANGVESTRDMLIEIERRHSDADEVAMGDDA